MDHDTPTFRFCGATCVFPHARHARTSDSQWAERSVFTTITRFLDRSHVDAFTALLSSKFLPGLGPRPPAALSSAMLCDSTPCTAPSGVLSLTYEKAQTEVRTLPKTARVSFSSNVPRTEQSDWPQIHLPIQAPILPNVAPGNALVEKISSPTHRLP